MAHAALENSLQQDEGLPLVAHIERDIHTAPNHVRESMNGALIAIALIDDSCEKIALAAARRIGIVEVDHGETSCNRQTPLLTSPSAWSTAPSRPPSVPKNARRGVEGLGGGRPGAHVVGGCRRSAKPT